MQCELYGNNLLVPILMLFAVLDPIGNSLYFYILTKNYSSETCNRITSMTISVAMFITLFFAVLCDITFNILDVTVDDFRIAIGIILLIYFIAILLEINLGLKQPSDENIAVVPLAMPLLSGPTAIFTVVYIKHAWGIKFSHKCDCKYYHNITGTIGKRHPIQVYGQEWQFSIRKVDGNDNGSFRRILDERSITPKILSGW
ncbi:MAG: hypothetical protein F7B60_03960 [Desulfurococcales archaeon]|nr:hypothetical protein [Desulfurococcales archaeon]